MPSSAALLKSSGSLLVKYFNNLKILVKMLIILTVVILFFSVIFIASLGMINREREALKEIYEKEADIELLSQISESLADINMNMYRVISWVSSGTHEQDFITESVNHQKASLQELNILTQESLEELSFSAESQELWENILAGLNQYDNYFQTVADSVTGKGLSSMATFFMISADDEYLKINNIVDDLQIREKENFLYVIEQSELMQKNMIRTFTLLFAFMFVTLLTTIMIITRGITHPISKTLDYLKILQSGNLTVDENLDTKDEIGQISYAVNELRLFLSTLVTSIKKQADRLGGIGFDLSSNMDETSAAITQITANLENISRMTSDQSKSVNRTEDKIEDISININKLNTLLVDQSEKLTDSTDVIDVLISGITQVSQSLEENSHDVTRLSSTSEQGREDLKEVSARISEIAKDSESLLEISNVIQNIASQTNLLSMNAAIEAAHAGASGKGFSIVADEIRKLAELSGAQAKTISDVLSRITDSLKLITSSSDQVLNQFIDVDNKVKEIAQRESEISSTMQTQKRSSSHVLERITALNDISAQVKTSADQMDVSNREISLEGKTLVRISAEVTQGMGEISSGIREINSAVGEVSKISNKNKGSIETLLEEVSRFQVKE
jgi:methyl-accepting chemotaxis protein